MSTSTHTFSASTTRAPASPATSNKPPSNRIVAATVPPAEPLYDVINSHGKFLLLGVPHPAACQAIDEHQIDPDTHPQWHGDISIRSVRLRPDVVDCRASVLRASGRLVVRCDIDHFIPSGLSVPELFASLRPQLVAAIEDAAACGPDGGGAPRPPSVAIDVGFADPSITLSVNSPSASLLNLDECLGKLEAILESLIATERPPGPHDGPLVWLGDNLGGDGTVLVDARSHFGQVGLELEQALRRIDQFDAAGQQRLIAGLRQQFDTDLGAAR